MAVSVVLAVGDVAEPLVAAIKELRKITVGPGLEDGSEMGPLITRSTATRSSTIASGAEQGATLVVDDRESAPN